MNSTPADAQKAPKESGSRILVIEDDPGVLDVIDYLFSELGLVGEIFDDTAEALEHADAAPGFAAVLFDLDVCRTGHSEFVRKLARHGPVVALAGAGPGANVSLGALAVVVKPFGIKALSLAIEKALGWAGTRR
ncbi:MAG: hypothetical protein IT462_00140 [Planctomycetes bacterium]|nr:hypothetical protein [Planctomycetota bacterium]